MNFWSNVKNKLSILYSVFEFVRTGGRLWLAPLIFILVLFAIFIVVTEGSALAPLIYTLF